MIPFSDRQVETVFLAYPDLVRPKMLALRDLIYLTVEEIGELGSLEESLKWGEPAYRCKTGSTLRIDWKESDPSKYRMFFHCQTSLISTFREVYSDTFQFEGNRAICFLVDRDPNLERLGKCVEVALRYRQVKDLPLLGMGE